VLARARHLCEGSAARLRATTYCAAVGDIPVQKPPAGWFHDPAGSGSLRWWDGSAWTEFRKPPDKPVTPPAAAAPAAAAPTVTSSAAPSAGPSVGSVAGPVRAPAQPAVTAGTYASVAGIWAYRMSMLPAQPAAKRSAFRIYPKGYGPANLTGKAVADIASAWGRPEWWAPEAATGGVVAGWDAAPDIAIHVTAGGICDRVLQRQYTEVDLSWWLRCLGDVLGRPRHEVTSFLGEPNARSGIGNGLLLLQWVRPGFHIALKFAEDGTCLGITSQHAASPMNV
jgi:hypothetical protein